jgi:hypothetical protein
MKKWLLILFMLPTILFGQNKCIGERLMLWVDDNDTWTYEWNTEPYLPIKSDSSIFIIDSLPEYITVWVEVTNANGCVGQAQISIQSEDCGFSIYFPNALVPSGENKTWMPKYHNVVIRELTIWDRWGNVQWTWQGSDFLGLNDKGNQLDGVFTFLCIYSPQGKKVEYRKIGSVTVVK